MALQAAQNIVIVHGYSGLSARKVASEIGYTVGSLYLVFRNLDDLIAQVNLRTLDDLLHALEDVINDEVHPEDCILSLGRAYINFAIQHSNRWKMVFEHRMPKGEVVPETYMDEVSRMFGLVQQYLHPLSGDHSEDEIALAARALWSGVHGIALLGLEQKLETAGGRSIQEVTDSLIKNYLAGFSASKHPA